MTPAQLAAIKAAILADPALAAITTGIATDYSAIVAAMNAEASPAFVLWRNSVTPDMWRAALTKGSAQMDALTAGKRDSLIFVCGGTLDATDSLIRSNLDDLCGSQNILKGFVIAAQKRNGTRVEKVLATGTGSDASPAILPVDAPSTISVPDVVEMFTNG